MHPLENLTNLLPVKHPLKRPILFLDAAGKAPAETPY